jgi:hypothetical protein
MECFSLIISRTVQRMLQWSLNRWPCIRSSVTNLKAREFGVGLLSSPLFHFCSLPSCSCSLSPQSPFISHLHSLSQRKKLKKEIVLVQERLPAMPVTYIQAIHSLNRGQESWLTVFFVFPSDWYQNRNFKQAVITSSPCFSCHIHLTTIALHTVD